MSYLGTRRTDQCQSKPKETITKMGMQLETHWNFKSGVKEGKLEQLECQIADTQIEPHLNAIDSVPN